MPSRLHGNGRRPGSPPFGPTPGSLPSLHQFPPPWRDSPPSGPHVANCLRAPPLHPSGGGHGPHRASFLPYTDTLAMDEKVQRSRNPLRSRLHEQQETVISGPVLPRTLVTATL